LQRIEELDRRVDDGESLVDIATDFGVTTRTLRNWLRDHGLASVQQRLQAQRSALMNDAQELHRRYVIEGQPLSVIAKTAHLSTREVRAVLDGFDIRREAPEPVLSAAMLCDAFAQGASVKSIARTTGYDRAAVRHAMRKYGIVNVRVAPQRPALLDDASWLRARYVDDGATFAEIARDVGSISRTVKAALVRQNITIRPPRVRLDPAMVRHRFVVEDATMAEIAAEAGVSVERVRTVLRQQGIGPKPRGQAKLEQRGVDWLHHEVVVRGRTQHTIATEAGVHTNAVAAAIKAHHLRRRPRRRGNAALGDAGWLSGRYLDDGATAADIAAETGVSISRVRRALARHGINHQSSPTAGPQGSQRSPVAPPKPSDRSSTPQ
jgi:transposase/transposase-like protein